MYTAEITDQTVLITGGAGFIGCHLARSLLPDNDVRIADSFISGRRANVPSESTLIEGDLRNEDVISKATSDVDLIFHEAALVSVKRSIDHPELSHEINVNATLSLLNAARAEDARIILASSAAIYGHPERVPIKETDPKMPTSPYGLDKLTIDHYAQQYHDLYGLETVSLRYFNAFGPGQVAGDYSGVISIFLEQALSGEPITVNGDGRQTRDFIFIDDIVQANLRAAITDAVGEAYNVGTSEAISIRKLADTVQEVTNSESEVVHNDPRPGDIEHSEADISKAKTHLEYEPTVSFREGLARTAEWYRSQ